MVNSTEVTNAFISESDLSTMKESLLFQKAEILNKRVEFMKEQSSLETISEEAELAATDLLNNISIHLHERERQSLVMIEKALQRIEAGTYGQCESCADEIGLRRIQARPFTTLCIACMEDQESVLQ